MADADAAEVEAGLDWNESNGISGLRTKEMQDGNARMDRTE